MKSSAFRGIELVFRKELMDGLRFKAAWLAMLMFALTTLSCVSLALGGAALEAELQAALLWVVLFFSAMTGIDRLFADEEMAGTMLVLRLYAPAQVVLFGKMLYAFFLLLVLAVFVAVLFLAFLDVRVEGELAFLGVLFLGVMGLAGGGTFVSALSAGSRVKSGLFPVLMLPVMLPVLLPAIAATTEAFRGGGVALPDIGSMAFYDGLLILGASVLFDYFWYEE